MIEDVELFSSFSALQTAFVSRCTGSPKRNLVASCQIQLSELATPAFGPVYSEAAEAYMASIPDQRYRVNHGSFYHGQKGLEYVAKELKSKSDSNRAILDLCNQDTFIGSGDTPVPSFLIAQFGVESGTLYYTAYFRALEASDFLKVNLEEARISCSYIAEGRGDIQQCVITIFAFRCYNREGASNANGLRIPEFDRLDGHELSRILRKQPERVVSLLRDRIGSPTAIEYRNFERWLEVFGNQEDNEDMAPPLKNLQVIQKVKECADFGKRLEAIRLSQSNTGHVESLIVEMNRQTRDLADLIASKL